MNAKRLLTAITLCAIILLAVSACGGGGDAEEPTSTVAPTQETTATEQASPAPTEAPTVAAVEAVEEVDEDEGCLDSALAADMSVVNPGEMFTKTWRILNTGDCEWDSPSGEFMWVFVSGDQMDGPIQTPIIGTVPPGGEYDVTVELTAPAEGGQYEGWWQLRDPEGQSVGPMFGLRVEVPGGAAEPPAEEPAAEEPPAEEPPAEEPAAEEPAAEEPPAEPGETCYDAAPVADVTIPDGTTIAPGETFVKTWRMRNTGTCEWNSPSGEFQWRYAGAEQMGGPDQVSIVGVIPPGGEYDVSVELTAPAAEGWYEGHWQLYDPDGQPIGVIFWVLIQVPEGEPSGAAASASRSSTGTADMPRQVWQLINGERDRHGLLQLAYNETLALAAQRHAEDCSQRGSCSHTGSDGSDVRTRVERVGYDGVSIDESWAWSASPEDAVAWWLDEVPPDDWHRRMLLSSSLTEVGVGVAPSPSGYFFVAVFGRASH